MKVNEVSIIKVYEWKHNYLILPVQDLSVNKHACIKVDQNRLTISHKSKSVK